MLPTSGGTAGERRQGLPEPPDGPHRIFDENRAGAASCGLKHQDRFNARGREGSEQDAGGDPASDAADCLELRLREMTGRGIGAVGLLQPQRRKLYFYSIAIAKLRPFRP